MFFCFFVFFNYVKDNNLFMFLQICNSIDIDQYHALSHNIVLILTLISADKQALIILMYGYKIDYF